MNKLPEISDVKVITYDYFPTVWQAVIWRNWGYLPVCRIAAALKTSEENIYNAATELGLSSATQADEVWQKRGYLTIIRNNWNLCTYEQLLILLDITEEQLAFILKEDDFMWVKLGGFRPEVIASYYEPLTKEQKEKTEKIKRLFEERFPVGVNAKDNAFQFVEEFNAPLVLEGKDLANTPGTESVRMIYPYFALYGDALIDENLDPFPERLLAEYAKAGINGIWMQGVLYQLVEFPFEPELSKGWEVRVRSLNRLVEKAKKFGIGVYLYLNEPRSMPNAFFEKYPHLRGESEDGYFAMCTSTPEVQEYLQSGMKKLFEQVPGLAGFFTITMSENLTNCYSRLFGKESICPRCKERNPWEVVAEVNNLMAKGAHESSPNAKAIAWAWGWSDWAEKVVPLLSEGQIVQCTSEENLKYCIHGIDGTVSDYSISRCGPGEKAKSVWNVARSTGHEVSAKVQLNVSWELATVPFLPVFDKIAEHMENLKQQGVTHLQASWTLGGCPSPNLSLVAWLMENKGTVEEFMQEYYGDKVGTGLYQAQKKLSEAFSEFPFHINVLYFAPQNFGPMAPFFLRQTEGFRASMVGYPYDDLERWRADYPEEIFEEQMKKVCDGFKEGLEMMLQYEGTSDKVDELILMTRVILCHYESAVHHITYNKYRGKDILSTSAEDRTKMIQVIRDEMTNVQRLIELKLKDSRIGYESSNHYFYSLQDLKEKMINLAYCEQMICNFQQ